jgi:CRISPR-associated protein Cas5d
MFKRRVSKGQCWRHPFFGTREFAGDFLTPEGNEHPIQETIPIGSMLFDIYYDEAGKPSPIFFYDVAVVNGVLECPTAVNEKMMTSSHCRPENEKEFSTAIYEFNLKEASEATL